MSALPSGLSGGNANLLPCVTNANVSLSVAPTSGMIYQTGTFVMPVANSNVVETNVIFKDTNYGAFACYNGAVNSAVSTIGTSVLSQSTFAVYAQGSLGVAWQALGN